MMEGNRNASLNGTRRKHLEVWEGDPEVHSWCGKGGEAESQRPLHPSPFALLGYASASPSVPQHPCFVLRKYFCCVDGPTAHYGIVTVVTLALQVTGAEGLCDLCQKANPQPPTAHAL